MQQLLTGQTRLPGFHGEWEVSTFSNLVRHHAGNSALIKGRLAHSPGSGLFPGFSASGQDVWCDHYDFEGEAIIVSAVGSRCGKAFTATGKWCAIANTHVVWPNESKVDRRFIGLYINDEDFWLKSGSGQPFILFKQTFARPIRLPTLPEQTAIAEILSDMDAELTSLEQRREKTLALKQAMMQELLTGKTRLV
jgi:type I restriction enzyme S subunit